MISIFKTRNILGMMSALFVQLVAPLVAEAIPAYPGAQGGGAVSVGGRGGRIIEVTSLADSGPGTLRACVLASGPRICVFKVAGDIKLTSGIYITNPYLTVAGQTAPGNGIQISGVASSQHMIMLATHDVIWQYTKIRKGYNPNNVTEFADGAALTMFSGSYNMIIDHNSVQWNQDEGIGVWSDTSVPVKNVTISNNLVAEGLAQHSTGYLTGSGSGVASQMTDIDFHHNLTMNNSHRNPLLTNKSSRVINNIFYNHSYYATQAGGGVSFDVIGNKFKRGPMSPSLVHEVQIYSVPSLYISGNVGHFQPNKDGEQWLLVSQVPGQNGYDSGTAAPLSSRRLTRLPDTQYPIAVESVDVIEGSILPAVGASRRLGCDGSWVSNRDSVDARLVNQYQTNTGITRLPVSEKDVGGFPVLDPGVACADADHDGMPDTYELARGLNPSNASDAIADQDGDGFTNIEEFLAGSGSNGPQPTPSPSPTPTPTPSPTPGAALSISSLVASSDSVNATYEYSYSGAATYHRLFFDTDNNATTGFSRAGIGADYMIENSTLYKYAGSAGSWAWTVQASSVPVDTGTSSQWTIARNALGSPSSLKVVGQVSDGVQSPYTLVIAQTFVDTQPAQDTIAPTVSITSPTGSVTRGSRTTIVAAANDNVAVSRVEIFVNDRLLCSDASAPYSCEWAIPKKSSTYNIRARAYDTKGNVGNSAIISVRAN